MIIALISAIVAGVIGVAVFLANTQRFANQAFALVSFVATLWLFLVFATLTSQDAVPWTRANAIVSSFWPWSLWILLTAIVTPNASRSAVFMRSLPWFAVGLAGIPFALSSTFVLTTGRSEQLDRGTGYVIHSTLSIVLYFSLVIIAAAKLRLQRGIRQVEIQFFVVNLGLGALLCLGFVLLGTFIRLPIIKDIGVFILGASYVITAWGIASRRVFDLRQVLTSIAQRLAMGTLLALGITCLMQLLRTRIPSPFDLFLAATLCGIAIIWTDRITRKALGLDGERELAKTRRQIIDVARGEHRTEELIVRFEALLQQLCRTDRVLVILDDSGIFKRDEVKLCKDTTHFLALVDTGWATPETLQRRRALSGLIELRELLISHRLGLVVSVPRDSKSPALVVAFGTKLNDYPFTYPEIESLQNLAELIDNIVTRSRVTADAALKAKNEHLAMMSRGLAHDLKNLLTPVSSFLVYAGDRFVRDTQEAEAYDAAARSVRVMQDYVRETGIFADKVAPQLESSNIDKLFKRLYDAIGTRATRSGVSVAVTITRDGDFTADVVLLQRVLANLVTNAIDASGRGQAVEVRGDHDGKRVRFEVADAGCGIPKESLGRIFEPYFSTKEFGSEVRGLGLGLTICQKIVALHQGSIVVQSEVGRGTTFVIELPLSPVAQPLEPVAT